MQDFIQMISVGALPMIFAITVHEAAHGYAARFFGDMTADRAGRITLNPLKHVDPVGRTRKNSLAFSRDCAIQILVCALPYFGLIGIAQVHPFRPLH
jgi:Zn-dependent protease